MVFGEVWVCSGQSNMWLPMGFSLSRNHTYDALRAGKLSHIRLHTVSHHRRRLLCRRAQGQHSTQPASLLPTARTAERFSEAD